MRTILPAILLSFAICVSIGHAAVTNPSTIIQPTELAQPAVGVSAMDAGFSTRLRRVSDKSNSGGFETQIYNQLQAFSTDNKYLLLISHAGYLVRRMNDMSLVKNLDTSTWNAPRWHPTKTHTIIHYDSNADQVLRVQFTNVDTLTTTTIFTFPAQYHYIRASQSHDEVSRDGRYMAGLATRNDNQPVIFGLDMIAGNLTVVHPVTDLYAGPCTPDPQWGEVEPDWMAASPQGRYVVVQWVRDGTERCSGLETFDITTGAFVGRVSDHHHHGDLGVDQDGSEFFMTTENSSPLDPNRPALATRALPGTTTSSQPNYLRVVDWTDEDHISCQGPAGVCLVSWGLYDDSGGSQVHDFPFQDELFLQYTSGSVSRLVHHRSSKCGYWVQPRASLSLDGKYAVFASDWDGLSLTSSCTQWSESMGRGDPFIIEISSSPPPPPPPPPNTRAVVAPMVFLLLR